MLSNLDSKDYQPGARLRQFLSQAAYLDIPANYFQDIDERLEYANRYKQNIFDKFSPSDSRSGGTTPSGATKVFTPFTSNYTSSTTTQNLWALQGIKVNPYQRQGNYIMTGTTGSALSSGGTGAVYLGRINGQSTSSGSGSGQWINFNVPFAGADGTSVYGPDILSRGHLEKYDQPLR